MATGRRLAGVARHREQGPPPIRLSQIVGGNDELKRPRVQRSKKKTSGCSRRHSSRRSRCSARWAQGGIGSERAGRPLRLSCQLVVGAQGAAYAAMKVALNSAVRPSLPHHQRLSVHPQKILGVHVARFESSSVKEVAEIVGVAEATIKTRIVRGITCFRPDQPGQREDLIARAGLPQQRSCGG